MDSEIPNCVIVTTPNGPINGCLQMKLPSAGWYITMMIVSILLFLLASWLIYKFLNSNNTKISYWLVLLIVFLGSFISGLIFYLLM